MSSTVASTSAPITNNTQPIANTTILTSQQQQQQDNGEPPFLAIGTEVSAKYKGAFCEATIQKVERLVKCRVTFKNNHGTAIVIDDNIRGNLRVGAWVEAKHPDLNSYLSATITKIIDASQYTVIFDDGDITTLRRTSLCLKSGKHFAESESLDHLPLTNPEHFGNPVSLNSRSNRRRRRRSAYSTATAYSNSTSANQFSDNDDNESIEGSNTSVDDEDSSSIVTHQSGSTTSNFKLNSSTGNSKDNGNSNSQDLGRVVCVEYGDKRSAKLKDLWFPCLVVSPSAQADNNKILDPAQDCLVKSFSNGRFYQIKRKDLKEFTKEMGNSILNDNCSSTSLKSAIEKALNYLDKNELPSSWDYETLIGSNNLTSPHDNAGEDENDSSDDLDSMLEEDEDLDDAKTVEEKDRFVAQLYKYMDERGTPINKTPTIWGDDLDLYNLYRLVIKMGGYNRVCTKNAWKAIYNKLNLPNNEVATQANANQLRLAYKKYLLNFVDFFRKLGCTMVDTCMYSSRGSSRTARSERNWRTLSESTKQQDTSNIKEKARRKKSTVETAAPNDKKEEEDKKIIEKPPTTAMKRARKNGRKKFKVEGDDSNVNGNEPEEKYIPNDSDFESDSDSNFSTPTISKDVVVNVGDRVRVKYGKGKQLKVYEAKVNLINQNEKYFVHYTGWNTRYDEWIKRNRIVEVVCDSNKSPKRRGGNKLKNKGVPLQIEEQSNASVKSDTPSTAKNETPAPPIASSGKRGRPPSALSFRNNQEKSTADISATTSKVKNESITNSNNKKAPAALPAKRNRQRSECVETDLEENTEQVENTTSNVNSKDVKKEALQTTNCENDTEMDVEPEEELSNDVTVKEQSIGKRGYKKLKRSDNLRKEEKLDVEPEQTTEETTSTGQKVIEDDLANKRKQRKKKNDKTTTDLSTSSISLTKEEENKPREQAVTVSNKKRKPQQQVVSSDEDDSSTGSSASNTVSDNSNKFTNKRKRILNSKYRQDNALVSKVEPTSNTTASSSTKEIESTKKRSKDENIKNEKLTDEPATTLPVAKTSKQTISSNSSDTKESDSVVTQPAPTSSTEINSTNNNFLLCKEEIHIPASPSCDESTNQAKNSNASDTVTIHQAKEPKASTLNTSVQTATASTKLCSANIDKSTSDLTQQPSSSSKQTSSSASGTNADTNNKKETEDSELVAQQFTPPTTPESLKSNNSTTSSNNEKEEIKATNDKSENSLPSSNQKIETHGLDMIAIASGVSKLVEIDKQNDKKESNSESTTPGNNFSPRKKRRGRGRTASQSEAQSNNSHSNVSSNLFNSSFSNKDKDNSSVRDSLYNKVKGCKTRGSLGRKVKQTQNNLDCMSESTSHSDNFEPTSPSSMLLNCISLESYNPTSKYNFCTPLDDNLESDRRIQILQERMQELRKTYLNIKSELATIERRRKKFKRKERSTPSSPGSQAENINKTNSPSSTSSSNSTKDHHQTTLQRSNSFTENSNLEENKGTSSTTGCNSTEQSQIKDIC